WLPHLLPMRHYMRRHLPAASSHEATCLQESHLTGMSRPELPQSGTAEPQRLPHSDSPSVEPAKTHQPRSWAYFAKRRPDCRSVRPKEWLLSLRTILQSLASRMALPVSACRIAAVPPRSPAG